MILLRSFPQIQKRVVHSFPVSYSPIPPVHLNVSKHKKRNRSPQMFYRYGRELNPDFFQLLERPALIMRTVVVCSFSYRPSYSRITYFLRTNMSRIPSPAPLHTPSPIVQAVQHATPSFQPPLAVKWDSPPHLMTHRPHCHLHLTSAG